MNYNDIIKKVYITANNAIYFDDNSDYYSALYEVCEIIRNEFIDGFPNEIGSNYIKE